MGTEETILDLHFIGRDVPTLERTCFRAPFSSEMHLCSRGISSSGQLEGRFCGTFQWTSAVQALAVLLVKSFGEDRSCSADDEIVFLDRGIAGEKSSLAASLDYALDKQPQWLVDMFGSDSSGRSLAFRMFKRSNPSRKRPGPVCIWLNSRFISQESIRIFWDGRLLCQNESKTLLEKILHTLRKSEQCAHRVQGSKTLAPETSGEINHKDFFRKHFQQEILTNLAQRSIFSTEALRKSISVICQNSLIQSLHKRPLILQSEYDRLLSREASFGTGISNAIIRKYFGLERPFRFAVGAGGISSIAIMHYLARYRNANMQVISHYGFSQDILQEVLAGNVSSCFDSFLATPVCAARIAGAKTKFRPLMFIPASTHNQIVSDRQQHVRDSGFLILPTQDLSTSDLYLADTTGRSDRKSSLPLIHSTCADILSLVQAQGADYSALLWWPACMLGHYLHPGKYESGIFQQKFAYNLGVLMVREDVFAESERMEVLCALIRDAWLSLLGNSEALLSIIDSMLDDARYEERFFSSNGLPGITMKSFCNQLEQKRVANSV